MTPDPTHMDCVTNDRKSCVFLSFATSWRFEFRNAYDDVWHATVQPIPSRKKDRLCIYAGSRSDAAKVSIASSDAFRRREPKFRVSAVLELPHPDDDPSGDSAPPDVVAVLEGATAPEATP